MWETFISYLHGNAEVKQDIQLLLLGIGKNKDLKNQTCLKQILLDGVRK